MIRKTKVPNTVAVTRDIVAVRLFGYQVDWRPRNAWVPFSIRWGKRPDWKHISLGPLGRINFGKVRVIVPAWREGDTDD